MTAHAVRVTAADAPGAHAARSAAHSRAARPRHGPGPAAADLERAAFARFNYTTGDAAGQNLTGKATHAACSWIVENYPTIERYFLESNFATDKKSSQVNMLRTRGKRVVAEAVIPNELF